MTRVSVHPYGTTIVLACGLIVEGRPQGNAEQAEIARELGYDDDVLQMVRDHDALHVALAGWLGFETFALREAAGLDVPAELAAAEEAAVLAVQKFMRLAGAAVPLPAD